ARVRGRTREAGGGGGEVGRLDPPVEPGLPGQGEGFGPRPALLLQRGGRVERVGGDGHGRGRAGGRRGAVDVAALHGEREVVEPGRGEGEERVPAGGVGPQHELSGGDRGAEHVRRVVPHD